MGKSYKKHAGGKYFGESDKEDKVVAHKKFRRKSKDLLRIQPNVIDYTDYNDPDVETMDIEEEYKDLPINLREVSDVYNFRSDGGSYYCSEEQANSSKSCLKAFKRK